MYVCGECGERADRPGSCGRDGSALAETEDTMLGAMVGRYRIARLLGQGGMGRVYLAVQPELGSRVAIKVIADRHVDDPALLERFFAEARAVNLIRHENIVSVLDLDRLPDGRPVIVMELIEGQTLRALERAGALPIGGVIQAVSEVLSALAAAHAIGIIHRDLKPDNILITASGRAKVLDFGIAKLAVDLPGHPTPQTRTGVVLGTPEYMSPEQIGDGTVDARSDLYAVGVVLFEALTRRLPFHELHGFELMRAHVEQPPPSPRTLRPEVSPELEAVILTALAKQRGQRFESADAMANALHAAAATIGSDQWRALTPTGRLFPRSTDPPAPRSSPATAETGPLSTSTAVPTMRERPAARKLEPPIVVTVPERPVAKRDPHTRPPAPPAAPRRRRLPLALALVAGAVAIAAAVTVIATRGQPVAPAPSVVSPITPTDPGVGKAPSGSATAPFDPLANVDRAQQLARAQVADAQLVLIDFLGLRSDGLGPGGGGIYLFGSPTSTSCIVVTQQLQAYQAAGSCRGKGFVAHPKCKLAQLFARALGSAQPPDRGLRLTWLQQQDTPKWVVEIPAQPEPTRVTLDDNCR